MQRGSRSAGSRRHTAFCTAVVLVLVVAAAPGSPADSVDAKALAREILSATGVKGGLVVHLGCGDGKLTAALRANDRYLVHGLDADARNVEEARRHIQSAGLYGRVSVDQLRGNRLPYIGNLVNLFVAEHLGEVRMREVRRVLAPNGVAYIKSGRKWMKNVKPWPEDIDEWTHFLHGPDNNAVAEDTRVGPPRHVQWVAGPRWARSHEHLASMSAAVSASGRLFYVVDEGSVASIKAPPKWMLVARDAFNGVVLWKKPVGPWEGHLRPFRSGPAELPRRLVAVGDRVYVTLGYGKPVTALEAATGEVLRQYEGTENTHEILCHEGRLYLVVSAPLKEDSPTTGRVLRRFPLWRDVYAEYVTHYMPKHIRVVDAKTGALVWKKEDDEATNILPLTLAVSEGRVFFENEAHVMALDDRSGQVLWRAERPVVRHRYAWLTPTLVAKDGVVLSADRSAQEPVDTGGEDETRLEWRVSANHILTGGEMVAFSAATGKKLWTAPCHEGFNSPVDVFVAQGKVWSGELAWPRQPGITQVYDVHTGEVVAKRPPDQDTYTIGFGHARCYRNKATTKYVIQGRNGVEFLDMSSDAVVSYHWIRGTCQYGILPCNGLLYVPPHSCACHIEGKLNSFNALAAKRDEGRRVSDPGDEAPRLERGPAYGLTGNGRPATGDPNDWPTYRHDGQRSGAAGFSLSPQLGLRWERASRGPLSSLVIAKGKLLFAQTEAHTVHALDAADGSPRWQYTAGGRVDSPPTVHGGLVYFGSADGWIYCVRATDGELAWRFRAASESRHTVVYEQLESVWPVHGSVLVHHSDDQSSTPVLYAVAGRSSFLDGGMLLYRLHAHTGALLSEQRISDEHPGLPDILATDGASLFMRHMRFDMQAHPQRPDVEHLFSPAGFLDDTWWHRTYWQLGTRMFGGYSGWQRAGNSRVSGRLLVQDGDRVFGFGRRAYSNVSSHLEADYHLFRADAKLVRPQPASGQKQEGREGRAPATTVDYHWSVELPFHPRAMVLAGETLFVAGPSEVADFAARDPRGSVWLWAVSATDGAKKAEYRLKASPVSDGMAAAQGRLYMATTDGKVVCMGGQE